MAPPAIREFLEAQPFQPFSIRLPDGERVLIPTADHAFLSPAGRRLLVFSDDDRMRTFDPILISELESAATEV
ncbi:MAG: hypothetical protein WA771_13085 [Chthoniobacterales bacterium]